MTAPTTRSEPNARSVDRQLVGAEGEATLELAERVSDPEPPRCHGMRATILACLLMTTMAMPARALACDAECTEASARRHAWGTFFSQTGFALAAGIAVPVIASTSWNLERNETVVIQFGPALSGAGMALGLLAEEGHWDAGLGWALAGTWPGAVLGASVGVAGALLAAPNDRDALYAAAGIGAAAGALTGALAWYAEHADGGRPGALTGGFYAGYFTGLFAGLAAYAMGEGPEATVAPLLASATGAVLGVLMAELLRSAQ